MLDPYHPRENTEIRFGQRGLAVICGRPESPNLRGYYSCRKDSIGSMLAAR